MQMDQRGKGDGGTGRLDRTHGTRLARARVMTVAAGAEAGAGDGQHGSQKRFPPSPSHR